MYYTLGDNGKDTAVNKTGKNIVSGNEVVSIHRECGETDN
jgi:hypothetical protein